MATRVPADRPDLCPGSHWHWESFNNKLQRISVLCALSGHIPNSLNLRQAHESYLASADNFLEVQNGDLSTLDGSYIVEDSSSRSTIIRAGATEQGFCKRWKEHQKASLLRMTSQKQRRFSLLFPDTTVAEGVKGRMGVFQDLKQRVGLGIERGRRGIKFWLCLTEVIRKR